MKEWLRSLVTNAQGIVDEARISAILIVITFIGMVLVDILGHGNKFDMQAYGLGSAAMAGGIGAWFYGRGDK